MRLREDSLKPVLLQYDAHVAVRVGSGWLESVGTQRPGFGAWGRSWPGADGRGGPLMGELMTHGLETDPC